MQVVTSDNMQQLIETGKVDEFKPPEAPKASEVKLRADDGKFVSVDPTGQESIDKLSEKDDKQATAEPTAEVKADDKPGEDSDADLTVKVRKRIDAKHRLWKDAEEFGEKQFSRAKAAEQRADELEAKLKAAGDAKSGPAPDPDEPKQDDFKTVGDYARALARYEVAKARREDNQQAEESRQKSAQAEFERSFVARVDKAKAEIPDYSEVMKKASVQIGGEDTPPHITQFIAESDTGPQVAYLLAKNRSEYDRISQLSPIRAIAELGKLEKSLEKPAKDPVKAPTVSKAPSPITPLDSSQATTVQTDPSKMSLQQLREYEREESRKRRNR